MCRCLCVSRLADVWVSPDGGYTVSHMASVQPQSDLCVVPCPLLTLPVSLRGVVLRCFAQWSVCGSEHYWPDRRDVAAVFDSDEYFYIVGGRESGAASAPQYNDVYRSSFSFNELSKVAQACSVNIPWCGPGLSCWPGDEGTSVYEGGVACQWTRWCEGNSSTPWLPSSTGGTRPTVPSSTARVRPFDPCRDMIPVPAECDNYVGDSTGAAAGAAAGLTSWAIGGIVFIVATVVGGLLYFLYRRWRGSSAPVEGKLDSHLLGTTEGQTA